ncbi:hypothetical protein JTE90_008318 [Oedothorax gibbosus]|uniref:Integrase catalytic domain-containing protein n=1 Tax=Oedothorax gibbosus TaxID=931172 RepID=A0AAV6TUK9_9ARAC|nr:hypothetical protein JTE90_008318 [Oedothorax gibbosus]
MQVLMVLALGVVLFHPTPEGDRPIAFASRSLTKAEKNYSHLEKGALAFVFGVTRFRNYLLGREFTLVTDHQPLLSLLSETKPVPTVAAARIQRWALTLAAYAYKIKFKPGKDHSNADAFSRLPVPENCQEPAQPAELVLMMQRIHIDHAGPVEGHTLLLIVDAYSKWLEVVPVPSTSTAATLDVLRDIFARFGLPKSLVSDNGTSFSSETFRQLMQSNGIDLIRIAPYHPNSNGLAEKAVWIVKAGLRKIKGESFRVRLSRYLAYETDAVKALLDIPGVDVNGPEVGWKMDSLLHLAVHNSHCTLTMVKLLVSRGAQLDKVNRHGDTPLHYAVTNEECQPVVIQFLLQKRAVVNVRNKRNKSPLRVAIEQDRSVEVIHLLLGAGAKLSVLKDKMDYSLLKLVVDLYEEKAARELARERERAYFRVKDKKRLLEKDSETSLSSLWERLEVVIAYAYLENAEVTMEYLSGRWQNSPQLLDFSKKYSEDFKKMATTDLGRGHTLLEFLNSRSRCQKRLKSKYYKLCRLLAVVRNFPTFFNVIAEKVGVESMKAALRNLKVSVVKESSVPIIEESSVPAIEESSVPDIDESSVPIIEDFSVPIIEESSVPIIEESSVPDIDESSVPAIEESSFPDIEEYSISAVDDPLTSTEDGYRKSNGTWVQRVFGVSTVPNSSCSVRDDSCASTVSESSVFTIDNICDLTSNNSVVEVFSASTIPTCTNNSSSSEVNGSIVPTVIDLCDSDDSSFPEVQKSSNSSVSSVNGDSKVVISGVSIADDTRVSTVADFNDSTVEDYSASELDIAYFITVGDSTVNTSSVSTVDDSNVSTVDVSSSVSKTDSSTVSAVDDSRVSTVADSTLQEPNRSEQRIYLNYECLCDIARFLSSSDLLCFVLAFGVPCRNAVAVEVSKDVPPETESCSPSADKPTKEQESTVSTDVQPRTELCSPSTDKPTKEQESTESKGLQTKTECPSTNKPTHKQESTVSKDLQPKKDPCSPTLDKPIKEQESTVNDDVQSHAGSSRLPTKEQNSPSCKRKSVPLCPKHQPTCCQHSSVNDDIQSHAGPSRLPTKEQNSPSCKRVSVPLCPKHQPTCGQHSSVNEDIQSQAGPSRLPAREQNSPSCKRVPLCSKHQPTCNSALSVNKDIQSQAGPSWLPCATREQNLPRCKRTSIPLCPKHPPTCCHHKHRNSHDPYWKKKKKRNYSSFPSTSSDENHKSLPKGRQKKRKRNSRCNIHVNKTASSQDS